MAINLTQGAISIMNTADGTPDIKPVLQVMEVRLIPSQAQPKNGNERFRIVLSDGLEQQQGMLTTQRNDLIKSGRLQKGSIIQLSQFVCSILQGRRIIIIIDLEVILQEHDLIGSPAPLPRSSGPVQTSTNQPGTVTDNPQSLGNNSLAGGMITKPDVAGTPLQQPRMEQSHGTSYSSMADSGRYAATNAPPMYLKQEPSSGLPGPLSVSGSYGNQNIGFNNSRIEASRAPSNTSAHPAQKTYQQPPPMYSNRGPVAKNEAPPRIIPIAALNPYQGRWTVKARVTAKTELRHYNNPRGDGKVFSFDLLDSDGGEIRATCFNSVADVFFNQIEVGKIYLISKGTLKRANEAFNHLCNEHEILLESMSTIQPCLEDDTVIPRQLFHFRPIRDLEGMENNSIVDAIGVVSFLSPASSIMRKNGTEAQKRTLQLKDMCGLSVELTLWGNFCNSEGQILQSKCDSGVFPVLAVKAGRVYDFNGKSLGTISTTQLFIEPDIPEAQSLREWFDKEGRNTPLVSISRGTSGVGKTNIRKTISQIKDEKLGTSEKPDWITVGATVSFIKVDNFCYTACPIMIGDRQCNKKVTNNGDGKWQCDRCNQSMDECDYRYILQFQIQDHTGLTWVTAFQECGEEIMGLSAKDLYLLKYEEQDDEKFAEIIRKVLFTKYIMKLKVKEETFSDEQRVKSTIVKADKINFTSESKFLLDLIGKITVEEPSVFLSNANTISKTGVGNVGSVQPTPVAMNYMGNTINTGREFGLPTNQSSQYGNQYSGCRPAATGASGTYMSCSSCGGSGHSSTNCPSILNGPGNSGGGYTNRISPVVGVGNGSSECYKCHQHGHWAKDCPTTNAIPPAYGSSGVQRYGGGPNQWVGGH